MEKLVWKIQFEQVSIHLWKDTNENESRRCMGNSLKIKDCIRKKGFLHYWVKMFFFLLSQTSMSAALLRATSMPDASMNWDLSVVSVRLGFMVMVSIVPSRKVSKTCYYHSNIFFNTATIDLRYNSAFLWQFALISPHMFKVLHHIQNSPPQN